MQSTENYDFNDSYLMNGLLLTGGDNDASYPQKLSSGVNSEAANEENFETSRKDSDSSTRLSTLANVTV